MTMLIKNELLESFVGKMLRFKVPTYLDIYDKDNLSHFAVSVPVSKDKVCFCLKYTLTDEKSNNSKTSNNKLKTVQLFLMFPGNPKIFLKGMTFQKFVYNIKQENYIHPEIEISKLLELEDLS